MANKDVSKYDGPAAIDISALAPQLVDIKDGERRGYKREVIAPPRFSSPAKSAPKAARDRETLPGWCQPLL